jgi:hypothetical protein
MDSARFLSNPEDSPDVLPGFRRHALVAQSGITSLSLWKDRPLRAQPDSTIPLERRRTICKRCNGRIDGRPLPRQLAALSLLHLALCRACYLDVEESASSFGESGRAFEDRLFAKLAALADELSTKG